MADPVDFKAQVLDFIKGLTPDEAKTVFKDFTFDLQSAGQFAIKKITEETKKAGDELKKGTKDLTQEIKKNFSDMKLQDTLREMSPEFTNLTDNLGLSGEGIKNMAVSTISLGLAVKGLSLLPKPDIFVNFGKDISDSGERTAALTDQVDYVLKQLNIDPSKSLFGTIITEAAKAADSTKRMENALIETAAASGQLNTLFNETSDGFKDIDQKLVEYADMTSTAATATGMTAHQVSEWASALSKIPGALDSNVKLTSSSGREMNVLTAALKTAAGSGMEFKDVFSEIDKMYMNFGEEGGKSFQNTLEYVSQLSQATQNLKMPLALVKSYTDGVSESFRFFGNNSQSAINIISRLGPALKDSGLGPQAIEQLTQHVTDNIAKMSLAERSFLSSQTGGPGGLRGGYQIELLKQQGRVDEIEKKAEQALRKQFGGRVVTLDEASKDEGAARQLAKQVQLITSGPTKLVDSEGEAYKFFDAMKKGIASPDLKKPQDALASTVDRGTKLQERSNTILTSILNTLQKNNQINETGISEVVRGMLGPGEGGTDQSSFISKQMNDASNAGRFNTLYRLNRPGTEQPGVGEFLNNSKDQLLNKIDTEGGVWNAIKNNVKDLQVDPLSNSYPEMIEPEVKKLGGGQEKSSKAEIIVATVCPLCQKKQNEVAAAKIVDNKIALYDRGKTIHNHTGSPTSTA